MSSTAKKLAWSGAVAVAIGAAMLFVKGTASVSSCDPYVLFVNAGAEHPLQYYRFDGSTRPLSGVAIGHYFDSMGADHTQGYAMDFGAGKMEIPTASGALCPDGLPCHTYPAPIIDSPTENNPAQTVCDRYRSSNGVHAKPCPSGLTIAAYSAAIKAMPQWVPPGTACGHFPTPTPTGGIPPTATKTATWTSTPTPVVTVVPTQEPTKAPTPCQVCIPCTPTVTPNPNRFTPTPTPQPRFTPTKKAA